MGTSARLNLSQVRTAVARKLRTTQSASKYVGKIVRRNGEFCAVVAHDRERARVFVADPRGLRGIDEAEFLSAAVSVLPGDVSAQGRMFASKDATQLCAEDRAYLRSGGLLEAEG